MGYTAGTFLAKNVMNHCIFLLFTTCVVIITLIFLYSDEKSMLYLSNILVIFSLIVTFLMTMNTFYPGYRAFCLLIWAIIVCLIQFPSRYFIKDDDSLEIFGIAMSIAAACMAAATVYLFIFSFYEKENKDHQKDFLSRIQEDRLSTNRSSNIIIIPSS